MHEELKGLIVPVSTPFKETGEIDSHAFIQHLDSWHSMACAGSW